MGKLSNFDKKKIKIKLVDFLSIFKIVVRLTMGKFSNFDKKFKSELYKILKIELSQFLKFSKGNSHGQFFQF